MLASFYWNKHYASNTRLNNQACLSSSGEVFWGAWCTDKQDKKQFLQVKTIIMIIIMIIIIINNSFLLTLTEINEPLVVKKPNFIR